MNKNIHKLLRDYDRDIAFKKDPDELKQKLNLVKPERPSGHPLLWRSLGYAATAVICIGVAFPVGYILAKEGHIGFPLTTNDPIAAGEAYLIRNFDTSLRTPVLTYFNENDYQIALYFAIDDDENYCFFINNTKQDGYLVFSNPVLSLDQTFSTPFGSFALDTDESVDFSLDLYEAETLIEHWDVTFDIPTYLTHI